MQTKPLCVLIHTGTKREVGTVYKHVNAPPVIFADRSKAVFIW